MISVYADGSSSGGSGKPGGYGWIIVRGEDQVLAWSYGGSPCTTNNLMEMEGAIRGLEAALELKLHESGELIELVSDSQYTLGVASGAYAATKNLDSVERLQKAVEAVKCRLRWVRGHNGNQYNEICDTLAKQGKTENTSPELLAKRARKKGKKAVEPDASSVSSLTPSDPAANLNGVHEEATDHHQQRPLEAHQDHR